jgi:hypothetical protein
LTWSFWLYMAKVKLRNSSLCSFLYLVSSSLPSK